MFYSTTDTREYVSQLNVLLLKAKGNYEGWNFNSGNYLFTTDTK